MSLPDGGGGGQGAGGGGGGSTFRNKNRCVLVHFQIFLDLSSLRIFCRTRRLFYS
jgi:hypothetical protein